VQHVELALDNVRWLSLENSGMNFACRKGRELHVLSSTYQHLIQETVTCNLFIWDPSDWQISFRPVCMLVSERPPMIYKERVCIIYSCFVLGDYWRLRPDT
jgi:hypothetical protein